MGIFSIGTSQDYLGGSGNGSASVIDTIACPDGAFAIQQCSFDTTSQEPCVSPENYLVVECSSGGKFSLSPLLLSLPPLFTLTFHLLSIKYTLCIDA